jgi:hypothetical protein
VSTGALNDNIVHITVKTTNVTLFALEPDNITQTQLDNLLTQEALCLNHLLSRKLKKLIKRNLADVSVIINFVQKNMDC